MAASLLASPRTARRTFSGFVHAACTLCGSNSSREIHRTQITAKQLQQHQYCRCDNCRLVWQASARPDATAELAHYGWHENSPHDERYRRHLAPLADAIAERVPQGSIGLDYGCGPGPTLSLLLAERGLPGCVDYDPYFFPEPQLGAGDCHTAGTGTSSLPQFDYIVSSEVWEHFYSPRKEISHCSNALLRPGGWLGVMTSRISDGTTNAPPAAMNDRQENRIPAAGCVDHDDAVAVPAVSAIDPFDSENPTDETFPKWHYHRDPTHVSFYAPESFRHCARWLGWDRLDFVSPSIVLARKNVAESPAVDTVEAPLRP